LSNIAEFIIDCTVLFGAEPPDSASPSMQYSYLAPDKIVYAYISNKEEFS